MIEANTPEWFAARLGKVTASRVADLMAKTKTGWGASRANYKAELIAERLTGTNAESYKNAAMQWGCDHEAEAISSYVFFMDAVVAPAGFLDHPKIAMAGATPDGYVAADGLIEVKCPNTATHLETLLGQSVPAKYTTQCQFQMAVTGRQWTDFVSYDPRLPEAMRLFVKRLQRDDKLIAELEKEVAAFLTEIDTTLANLGRLYPLPGITPAPSVKEQLVASVKATGIPLGDILRAG
jgi:putative phage-type endonuclease